MPKTLLCEGKEWKSRKNVIASLLQQQYIMLGKVGEFYLINWKVLKADPRLHWEQRFCL